ncbi:MAG: hypothetical protein OEY51_09165, partial [Cyclobacteriaceae bacterium]|nr:hypothetical protein [Cyclobacteriaceae bacterium]
MRTISFLILSVCMVSMLRGQEYYQNVYTVKEGLSQEYIYTLLQDNDGYLWVGTGNGIDRFDGSTFENLSAKDSIEGHFISASMISDEYLFFGHFQGGMTRIRGNEMNLREDSLLVSLGKISNMAKGKDHVIWAFTQSNGFFRYEKGKYKIFTPKFLEEVIVSTGVYVNGKIMLGTSNGLFLVTVDDNNNPDPGSVSHLLEGVQVNSLRESNDGKYVWMGTSFRGFAKISLANLDRDQEKAISFEEGQFTEMSIVDIEEDDNIIWVATKSNGLYKIRLLGEKCRVEKELTEETGFVTNYIADLLLDREGSLWIGTYGAGLVQLIEKKFTHYPLPGPQFNSNILSVINIGNDEFLLGSDSGLVHMEINDLYNNTAFQHLPGELVTKQINSFLYFSADEIWAVVDGSELYAITIPGFEIERKELPEEFKGNEIRLFTKGRKSGFWVSVINKGLYHLDNNLNIIANYSTLNGFIHNEIFTVYEDTRHGVWVGTKAAGIAVIMPDGQIDYLSQKGAFPVRDINAIAGDHDGTIWIASDGEGLFMYKDSTFYSFNTELGLMSDYCRYIHVDYNNDIWIVHKNGLSQIQDKTRKIKKFHSADGLGKEAINSGSMCTYGESGFLAGSSSGLIRAYTNTRNRNATFVPVLRKIDLFFKEADLAKIMGVDYFDLNKDNLILPHDSNHLTFDFVAISQTRSHELYYRYKLKGYDKDWSPPKKESSALYTNLSPGKYTLQVAASDDVNIWVDETLSFNFRISIPFWES